MIIAPAFVGWLSIVEYLRTGGRHTPALYFLLYMTALMVVCTMLADQMPFSIAGFYFLAVISGAFWLGHLCVSLIFGKVESLSEQDSEEHSLEHLLTLPVTWRALNITVQFGIVAGVLSLISLFQAARSAGIEVSSFSDLAKLPAYYSTSRYATGVQSAEPDAVRFFTLFLEAASAAAGLMRAVPSTRRQRLLQYSPLVAALLMTLITGARSYFFLNCTWFFGSLIAMFCVRGAVFEQLRSPIFWAKSVVVIAFAFLFGSIFALLRYFGESLQTPTFEQFLAQLIPVMASSLQSIVTGTVVFDRMVDSDMPLHFAAYTFAPVVAWFGMESFRYPPSVFLNNGLSDSNQYSLVGFLLIDFGPLLTASIYFITGGIAAAVVNLVRTGVIAALPLLIAIMCVIIFSPIHNFFFFTTHVALLFLMTLGWSALQWWSTQQEQV